MLTALEGCGTDARPPVGPVAVSIALPAGEASAAAPTGPSGRFRCEVEVLAYGAEVVGEAHREGGGDLGDEAWRAACDALRAETKLDCEDDEHVVQASRSQRMSVINGKMTQSLRIVLQPILARLRGTEAASTSHEEACQRAVQHACSRAPKRSECTAEGLFCTADSADPSMWHCSHEPHTGG